MTANLLEIDGISVSFDGVHAVQEFSLEVPAGARVAVIGPNGAGKSTIVRCIAGDLHPDAGTIRFDGTPVGRTSPATRARRGIARTFQNLELFGSMTVLDNVLSAFDSEHGLLASLTGGGRLAQRRARAMEMLELFQIARYADTAAASLPYGVRKLVELSRALACRPRLLLLDEPVAGLHDTQEFVASLKEVIDRQECTVVLVEHDMPTVQTICDDVHVLDSGRLISRGTYAEVAADPRVVEAYLGREH